MEVLVDQPGSEGISRTDGIGNMYLESGVLANLVTPYQQTAAVAAGDADDFELEVHTQSAGGRELVFVRKLIKLHYFWQFIVVQLHDVGEFHRLRQNVPRIK